MTTAADLARMVPGFDFLQGLLKNASTGLPSMPAVGQWIAPTLNPEEIEKRIQELKTVQFWLEQNARLLGVTIQALEVQRMTLSTLKTMNLPLAELSEALKMKGVSAVMDKSATESAPVLAPAADAASSTSSTKTAAVGSGNPPAVDPLHWWSALTQQFTDLASQAVKHSVEELNLPAAAVGKKPTPVKKAAAPQMAKNKAAPNKAASKRAVLKTVAAKKRSASTARKKA